MVTVIEIIDRAQLVMVVFGFAANIVTVMTLIRNGKFFSPAILTFLRHQSGIDAWVCFITIIMLVQPPMWVSGNHALDLVVCHVWHGQALYWMAMFVSIWNLAAISFERYLAVCHPFKHGDFTKKKVMCTIFCIYLAAFIAMFACFLQVNYKDGVCMAEFAITGEVGKTFFYGYSIFCFLVNYALPCTVFFIMYGLVILAFRHRQRNSELAASRTIDKATAELTKTAVVVTVIFIVALGYDNWYYVLGYTGIVVYIKNSFLQKVGIFFASFNCVCNPLVYALLMPAYRKSVQMTFCLKCTSSSSMTSATSVSSTATQSSNDVSMNGQNQYF